MGQRSYSWISDRRLNENGYSLPQITMENKGKWEKRSFPKPQPISFVANNVLAIMKGL